ncbi:hypothetical protein EON81_07180 [bacterium]|nr:MAG: hypothetical protein EON81_07180 [bacterium]
MNFARGAVAGLFLLIGTAHAQEQRAHEDILPFTFEGAAKIVASLANQSLLPEAFTIRQVETGRFLVKDDEAKGSLTIESRTLRIVARSGKTKPASQAWQTAVAKAVGISNSPMNLTLADFSVISKDGKIFLPCSYHSNSPGAYGVLIFSKEGQFIRRIRGR